MGDHREETVKAGGDRGKTHIVFTYLPDCIRKSPEEQNRKLSLRTYKEGHRRSRRNNRDPKGGAMKFIRDRSEFEQALIMMHNEGRSIRELQRQFQIGRNTVRRILRAHDNRRNNGHDVLKKTQKRPSKLDSFEPEIKRLLDKYPRITCVRILRN